MKDAWISVEDQLPETHEWVLVHFEDGKIAIEFRKYDGDFLQEAVHGHVTHWQPLVPPEGVKTDADQRTLV